MRSLVLALVALSLAACSRSSDVEPATSPRPASARAERFERRQGAALVALRRDLDHGRLEQALAHIAVAKSAGDEAPLLEARAAALAGRRVEALRLVEVAREKSPRDPEVYATAAEIYAASASFDSAWAEIRRGEETCGPAPELERARGCVWIAREGGAEKGLALLSSARDADPALPFVERPLAQAHLLVAKAATAEKNLARALDHVEASLVFDPDDVDARRLLSETRAAVGDFRGAIDVLEALVREGEPLASELALTYKRAGIAALLVHQRERALECFAAARARGLSDEELSTGARLLAEESAARTALGVEAYRAGDLAAAEQRFREALELEPLAIGAQNHLAVVLFQQKNFAGSIELWRAVLEEARVEKLELPEPVHENLAKAQFQSGDAEGAKVTLEEYLDREPFGEWVDTTRAMLALIDRPEPR